MNWPDPLLPLLLAGTFAVSSCASPSEVSRTDANRDNKLSTEEVENRLIDAIFEKEDKNKDGKVTKTEWANLNPESPDSFFEARDTNGNKVVELEEFHRYVDSSGLLDPLLDELDLDDDDIISIAEAYEAQASTSN
ncbi:MAG: hypothetical protein ACON5N_07720 [Akkermansiaceae bacterium]